MFDNVRARSTYDHISQRENMHIRRLRLTTVCDLKSGEDGEEQKNIQRASGAVSGRVGEGGGWVGGSTNDASAC